MTERVPDRAPLI